MDLVLELLSNIHSLNLRKIDENIQSIIKEREKLLFNIRARLPKAKNVNELLKLFKKTAASQNLLYYYHLCFC